MQEEGGGFWIYNNIVSSATFPRLSSFSVGLGEGIALLVLGDWTRGLDGGRTEGDGATNDGRGTVYTDTHTPTTHPAKRAPGQKESYTAERVRSRHYTCYCKRSGLVPGIGPPRPLNCQGYYKAMNEQSLDWGIVREREGKFAICRHLPTRRIAFPRARSTRVKLTKAA